MSNARREQQKKNRLSTAVTAVATGDEDAQRKAVMNVVQVWLDRLQLISTIVSAARVDLNRAASSSADSRHRQPSSQG